MEERLQKFLSRAGVASRRRAETLIGEGRVSVNGRVIRKMGVKVDPSRDEIRVDTQVIRAPATQLPPAPRAGGRHEPEKGAVLHSPPARIPPGAVYLAMNKPTGVLTTSSDDRGRPTVLDLLPRTRARVYPVGRLDEDSEGLLLLTNDGTLTNLLTHPRYEVPKTYDLRIRGEISPEDILKVERGVWLSEGKTGQARMKIRRRGRDISHVVLTLREGKNRELRRIFARLRHPVLSLRRTRLGPLELGKLRRGQVRRLTAAEVKALYAAALRPGWSPEPPPAGRHPPKRPSGTRARAPKGSR